MNSTPSDSDLNDQLGGQSLEKDESISESIESDMTVDTSSDLDSELEEDIEINTDTIRELRVIDIRIKVRQCPSGVESQDSQTLTSEICPTGTNGYIGRIGIGS